MGGPAAQPQGADVQRGQGTAIVCRYALTQAACGASAPSSAPGPCCPGAVLLPCPLDGDGERAAVGSCTCWTEVGSSQRPQVCSLISFLPDPVPALPSPVRRDSWTGHVGLRPRAPPRAGRAELAGAAVWLGRRLPCPEGRAQSAGPLLRQGRPRRPGVRSVVRSLQWPPDTARALDVWPPHVLLLPEQDERTCDSRPGRVTDAQRCVCPREGAAHRACP